jgi:hypothetical protein
MSGTLELDRLLAALAPQLMEGEFVFCTLASRQAPAGLSPVASIEEAEGTTVICRRESAAAAGLEFEGSFRQITLTVHSSLHAVGLLAAVSTALARGGIACNAVSGFHHDHLFVPSARADQALTVLAELAAAHRKR